MEFISQAFTIKSQRRVGEKGERREWEGGRRQYRTIKIIKIKILFCMNLQFPAPSPFPSK